MNTPLEEVVLKIFTIFGIYYPNKFYLSTVVPTAVTQINIWGGAIQKFDNEVILNAANNSYKHHPSYPPTIGEFVILCKLEQKEFNIKKEKKEEKTIVKKLEFPSNTNSILVFEEELFKIREILAKKGCFPCRKVI